jgi:hypothetical protein
MSVIETRAAILEQTIQGPILEIAFLGKHRDGDGHDMADRVKDILDAKQPAAVVLNMLNFKYRTGNDIGGIFQVFYYRAEAGNRPGCILADGDTKRSIVSLLGRAFEQSFGVEYFAEISDALVHLRRKLGGGPA